MRRIWPLLLASPVLVFVRGYCKFVFRLVESYYHVVYSLNLSYCFGLPVLLDIHNVLLWPKGNIGLSPSALSGFWLQSTDSQGFHGCLFGEKAGCSLTRFGAVVQQRTRLSAAGSAPRWSTCSGLRSSLGQSDVVTSFLYFCLFIPLEPLQDKLGVFGFTSVSSYKETILAKLWHPGGVCLGLAIILWFNFFNL